ncbi:MAG TPA: diacylglycerol kinase family protein [Ohtaekwangia sp.]
MKSFLRSFQYAWNGLRQALREERNLRVQLSVAIAVIVAGFYFRITNAEWCILLICIGLVLGFELLNSALENLVDLVQPERHPLAGKVKDMGAAAVLTVSFASLVAGVIIFWKYISHWTLIIAN